MIAIHQQVITFKVRDNSRVFKFLCSAVYASPHEILRRGLWEFLTSLASCIEGPWVLAGDFNSILEDSERIGGFTLVHGGCRLYQNFIFDHGFRDLGCMRHFFT